MQELVSQLKHQGALKTPRIIEAFLSADRKKFIPPGYEADAYLDAPLPIAHGQTISQPYTVAFMIELLAPKAGQKILDVGFGSGWTTAILSYIAGLSGRVYGVEILPEVFAYGEANLQKFSLKNVTLGLQSGRLGWQKHAPFDRILVSAAATSVPAELAGQLAAGGLMVIPIGKPYDCALTLVQRVGDNEFKEQIFPGFAFVPLIE